VVQIIKIKCMQISVVYILYHVEVDGIIENNNNKDIQINVPFKKPDVIFDT